MAVAASSALLVVDAPRALRAACVGDCNNDGRVRISEIQRSANVFNGLAALATCPYADGDGNGRVTSDEVHAAAESFLRNSTLCPTVIATPTPAVPAPAPVCFETRLHALEPGDEPIAVAAGDFNADGADDLMVLNAGTDSLTQLNNDGAGNFAQFGPVRFLGADTFPTYVAAFRKNADAFDDFVVVRGPTEEEERAETCLGCSTYWESVKGAFLPFTIAVGLDPVFVRAGDVDRNGTEDLVVVNESDDTLSVLQNDPAGGFFPRQEIDTVSFVVGVAIGDLNGDGAADLAAVGLDGAALHLNTKTRPPFRGCPQCIILDAGIVPADIEARDLNGDSRTDLIIADSFSSTITVHPGNGDGTFGTPLAIQSARGPETLAIADFNRDGLPDIAAASTSSDAIVVFLGAGAGQFAPESQPFHAGSRPRSLAVADFNGDGRPDLATAAQFDDAVGILLGTICPQTTGGGFRTVRSQSRTGRVRGRENP